MTGRTPWAVWTLAVLVACETSFIESGLEGSLSLAVSAAEDVDLFAIDLGRVHIEGPTTRTMEMEPGTTDTIVGLEEGTYSVALEGLAAGELEGFREVTGIGVGEGELTNVSATLRSFVPEPKPGFSLSARVEPGQPLSVEFTPVEDAVDYVVEWSTGPAFVSIQSATAATSSTSIGLSATGTYYIRVRARNRFGSVSRPLDLGSVIVADPLREPVISLSANSASFSAQAGGADPADQTIAVTNGGGGSLTGLATSITYTGGTPGWLTATVNPTTAPATLTLSAATGGLAVGTYTATVDVTSPAASNSPQSVAVTFTVSPPPPPSIVLSSQSASFSAQAGGADPADQTIAVTNGGGGSLTGLATSITYTGGTPGWLTATVNPTTAPATLTLSAATGSLAVGTYTATVDVTSPAASNSPQSVAVTFTVSPPPPPSIVLSSQSASFSAQAVGADPADQTIAVTNGGGGSLTGLATSITYAGGTPGWLTATVNPTTAPATLTLSAATGGLAVGTYTATVDVTSPVASNSPQSVAVTFTVSQPPPPSIVLSSNSASFSAQAVGADPADQTIAVTNGGGGSLTGLATSITYTGGTPGWLTATADPSTAPATLTLSAATGGLAVGTYTATVDVTSPVASNSPQSVAVTFTVTPPPAIALSANSASFGAQAGGADPADQTIDVTNGGSGSLTGLATSITYTGGTPGWLTATVNPTTAPATLTLSPATGSLAAGTYTATVDVTSPPASNSPQSVAVTFTVTPPPAIALSANSASFGAQAGGADPADQTIDVTNGGSGSLTGLATSITYTGGTPGWLTATVNPTTAPATLTLSPATGSLVAGTYTATVDATSPVASNSPQSVAVTFTVSQPPPPSIVLSSNSAPFSAQVGGADPADQTIAVTNGGGGSLTGLATSITYTGGTPGWLTATVNPTTAPATLTLSPATGSLAAGTYTATVDVTSPAASNSPQSVAVTFTVTPPPSIALSSNSAPFSAQVGGADPADQTIAVTNGGGGSLTGLATSITYTGGTPGWLTATVNPTTAPATLTLSPATGSLAAGTYTATVDVTSPPASNSPQSVAVTFTVTPPPAIALSANSASFGAQAGGADPADQTIDVTNGGSGSLTGLATSITYTGGTPGWLTATVNPTTAPATLTLSPATGGLVAGTYTATVDVTSPVASNSPQSVAVTFTVSPPPPPSIVLSSNSAPFSAQVGGADPADQTIAVTNGGGGSLTGLATSITYPGGTPGWLTATVNPTTAPATLTLSPATGSLAAGTYTATVDVTSPAASNSPQSVAVTFTVTPPPSIVLSSQSASFSGQAGADPADQTIAVTNGGGGSLTGLATSITYTGEMVGWLTATVNPTTAPATLTLSAATGSLAAGTYTATVDVTSPVADNSPQSVSVTFTVQAP